MGSRRPRRRARAIRLALLVLSAELAVTGCGGAPSVVMPAVKPQGLLSKDAAKRTYWHLPYVDGVTYQGVALGPDGAIWMCDGGFGTTLDRFAPSGPVEKHPLGYSPEEIVVGADGAFWLTTNESTVLRVTTSLHITAYPVSDEIVGGITLGGDGSVWFIEQYHLGRITPSVRLKEYPLVAGSTHFTGTSVSGIAWGSDARVWFGAFTSSHYIVSLVPATGAIQIEAPSTFSGGPVVAGPDGNIWYMDGATRSYQTVLVKLTTKGQATTYYGPAGFVQEGNPAGMVVGPDRALWFTTQRIQNNRVAGGGLVRYDIAANGFSTKVPPKHYEWEWDLAFDKNAIWMSANNQAQVFNAKLRH